VAFLPFGLVIDKWRWEVFSLGKIKPAGLQQILVGASPEVSGHRATRRTLGGRFRSWREVSRARHVPYMRYFLARIYQFQFQRALCKTAGYQGPLNRCSIYGNKAAGEKLNAMLSLGESKTVARSVGNPDRPARTRRKRG